MAENTDTQVASILASELANENLQLRQANIRLRVELAQAKEQAPDTPAPTKK